ncbi:MAG: tRNA (adenosine(37)-N6)-threonylcarbamoyltransferase complex ATPase subunit type 1 TsaE [Anaerolineae bacterium]|nr:tRNA (adenosine(37)-N6)-threonylcarbamoyltransferase complex ATPase subunit type 1 TsaE [Anaerolineae bacterium]
MSPILNPDDLDFTSHSEEQTRRLGERLGEFLQAGDVICLQGPLGSGKTRFAQGVGRGMGVRGIISSPSYTIVNEYRTPKGLTLYHVDFYRIEKGCFPGFDAGEVIGGSGVGVIEWPEKAREFIPEENLWVTFRHVDGMKRGMLFQAHGERYRELLRAFRMAAFGV